MMDAQRALLDELMGAARNLTDEEKKGYREVRWDDKDVCGCYLVRFCPHDLFVNTKSDLGPCPWIHDQKLKESFEQSSRHDLYVPRFEADLAQFCEKLVQDCDRKVRRGRERIAQDVEISSLLPMSAEKSEQLASYEEKMKKLLEQIECLGEEGKVDEAQALMKKVDLLNAEKTALVANERGLLSSQEKKMALCEICGSFLVANDAAERTQSHVSGKQHMGFGLVRDFIAEFKEKKDKAERVSGEKEVEGKRKREKDLDTAKENGRDTLKDKNPRERDRDADRQYQGRDRYGGRDGASIGRDRDRERERNRDRIRDRRYSRTKSRSPPRSISRSPTRHRSRRRS